MTQTVTTVMKVPQASVSTHRNRMKNDKTFRSYIPPNNARSTFWPMKVFSDKFKDRGTVSPDGKECPRDLLHHPDMVNLNYCLLRFVAKFL